MEAATVGDTETTKNQLYKNTHIYTNLKESIHGNHITELLFGQPPLMQSTTQTGTKRLSNDQKRISKLDSKLSRFGEIFQQFTHLFAMTLRHEYLLTLGVI